MSGASRKYIIQRRGGGVADLSQVSLATGALSIQETEAKGIWRVNAKHQIGIATSQEAGLSCDRWPVRVVISNAAMTAAGVHTCVRYWPITTIAGAAVSFQRKPLADDGPIRRLYDCVPDLDERLWIAYNAIAQRNVLHDLDPALATQTAQIMALLNVVNATNDQKVQLAAAIRAVLQACIVAGRVPYFQISADHLIKGIPHGNMHVAGAGGSASGTAITETALCLLLNRDRIKARYAEAEEGTITLAAYAIANMFRFGLQEAYEHTEYYTVVCAPVAGQASQYTITQVIAPQGIAAPADLVVNTVLNVADVKVHPTIAEVASALVIESGLMHYLFNHTTGGTLVTGALLSTLTMYKFIRSDMPDSEVEQITSIMYEALHPVNKRAIANIFFKKSLVTTHGRAASAPRYEDFLIDTFMQVRMNPFPAGSHKAFISVTVLKRVLEAGLGPFLPWAESISECINTCREVLHMGARAHIGSSYYTGSPPIAQPSSLDQFLPELAAYIQTMARSDSLAMSPHLGPETAARCNMNWSNLLRDLKAKDVSATSVDDVRRFLQTAGAVHFAFDPKDEATWAPAVQSATVAAQNIRDMF